MPGYGGAHCEEDLNHFCMLNTCENGGMCEEGPGESTHCVCTLGFTGDNCETALCLSDSCSSTGGTCMARVGSSPYCVCMPGFTGDTCSTDMDFCDIDTCSNRGDCVEGIGVIRTCRCMPGFSGNSCEIDLPSCTLTSCQNGGTCEEGEGESTHCVCMSGFTGDKCSISLLEEHVMCPAEQDSVWMLDYPVTTSGEVIKHNCSAIHIFSATARITGSYIANIITWSEYTKYNS